MPVTSKSILVTLGATTFLMAATAAMAAQQGTYGSQQATHGSQQGGAKQGAQFNSKEIAEFKKAYHGVLAISKKYSPKIQQVHNAQKAQALEREAQKKMVLAVKDSGLSVQKYNAIMGKLQQDPALRKKVMG